MHAKTSHNLLWLFFGLGLAFVAIAIQPEVLESKTIAKLGMLFLLLGVVATFLMYKLWGYDFDKSTGKSEAPAWAMVMHRALGYGFLITYAAIMAHMVPRMWLYQVEFPARTVAHIILGFSVGFLLIIKISIMQFFRHLEEWMPALGTTILWASVMLMALSAPVIFSEKDAFTPQSMARLKKVLPNAGLPEGTDLELLSETDTLTHGRYVLQTNCVKCHDMRTILLKPRKPSDWYRTVIRMGKKPALFAPISHQDELAVTSYLIAITPEMANSRKPKTLVERTPQAVYEEACSQCHDLSDVDDAPPKTADEVKSMIQRMIDENEAEFEPQDIPLIERYMIEKYVSSGA